jgi:MFS family permease
VLLGDRTFRLLFSAQAISLFGDGMINVALAFAVLEVGGSASSVGLVFALRTAPMVASLLVGGVVADRTSRRAVMVAADLVRLASQGAMAALLLAGSAEVWSLGVLAGVTGAATGFYMPAATGLLPAVVAPEQLQRANGARLTAMAGGEILGPLVAGALVVAASPGWAIGIDAATFAVSATLLARLRLPAVPPAGRATFLADLREGWREFRMRTWVWATVLVASLENAVWGAWSALGPVVADRELGGAAAWGTVLAAMGAGGVAGGLLAMWRRPRRPLVAFALIGVLFAVPLSLVAIPAPVAVLALGAFAGGIALMFGNAVFESTLQRHIPPESLSRVSAYDWFGSSAIRPLGLALWGPVAVTIGLGSALWLAAALFAALSLSLLALPSVRALRDQSTT